MSARGAIIGLNTDLNLLSRIANCVEVRFSDTETTREHLWMMLERADPLIAEIVDGIPRLKPCIAPVLDRLKTRLKRIEDSVGSDTLLPVCDLLEQLAYAEAIYAYRSVAKDHIPYTYQKETEEPQAAE
jgi:hypothetical protein